jgi:hypothetical protein
MDRSRMSCVLEALQQFLTPQVWKQAHQAWRRRQRSRCKGSRWTLQPLIWMLLFMTWGCGDSEGERFAMARACCVASQPKRRRPGSTLQGYQKALAQLPVPVLRALTAALRERLAEEFFAGLRVGEFLPLACDGTRLECPRTQELEQRLAHGCKPESAPMLSLTALVLLPLGLPWTWQWGQGTASETSQLRRMLGTLPPDSLLVLDAYYQGYALFEAIVHAGASFLVRASSRSWLYTEADVPLERFREGVFWYWPQEAQRKHQPPLRVRLLRVRGRKGDVWLLTNVLERRRLSHKNASRLYRWRWRNEGLFRHYKRLLGKVKLRSRTLRLVHREAEGAMIALQLLLALAAKQRTPRTFAGQTEWLLSSPRQMLLRIRGGIEARLRRLGPRQFAAYQLMLEQVRSDPRVRPRNIRKKCPRRKDHKPPKPPNFRVMDAHMKTILLKALQAA